MRTSRYIPEFDLESELPPLSLEDNMAEENENRIPTPNNEQSSNMWNSSRKADPSWKERVASRTIFKKKNLSKQRQAKNGVTQKPLAILALNKSTSQDHRSRKSSTQYTIRADNGSKPGMSIFDFLMNKGK